MTSAQQRILVDMRCSAVISTLGLVLIFLTSPSAGKTSSNPLPLITTRQLIDGHVSSCALNLC